MIEHKCPNCGEAMSSPDSLIGAAEKCPGCGSSVLVPSPHQAGGPPSDLSSRYDGVKPISSHSRRTTFEAHDLKTDRRVFIKALTASAGKGSDSEPAFYRELKFLETISKRLPEHLSVPVLDVGRWQSMPCFVQPFLPGWSLAHAMRKCDPFEGHSVLKVIEECLQILDSIHAAGVVHCDVSPENIHIVTEAAPPQAGGLPEEFEVRLVDFESAQWLSGTSGAAPSQILGKAPYMAPELARGQAPSSKSDLYALGIVFFELLAGRRPYTAESIQDVLALTDEAMWAMLLPQIPEPVQMLVHSMLKLDPEERVATASECVQAIRDLRDVASWLSSGRLPGGAWSAELETLTRHEVLSYIPIPTPEHELDTGEPAPELERRSEISTAFAVDLLKEDGTASSVDFSVLAPGSVTPGRSFLLEVWSYLSGEREEALSQALRRGQTIVQVTGQPATVKPGTELTFLLEMDGFTIDDPKLTILWRDTTANIAFIVKSPADIARGSYPGLVRVLHRGMLLTRLVFQIVIAETMEDRRTLQTQEKRYSTAFASYASQDRVDVLKRIQGIQTALPELDIFYDQKELRSGDQWAERLVAEVKRRDVLYLFWSQHARQSEWVEKEWRTALKYNGMDAICPVPLVSPEVVPPPSELAAKLHFNDWMLAYMSSTEHPGGEA